MTTLAVKPPSRIQFHLQPIRLSVRDSAVYVGTTNWRMEELIREGEIPFQFSGKTKVVCVRDLDAWVEKDRQEQL